MKKLKKGLSLLLAICMMLSLVIVPSYAEGEDSGAAAASLTMGTKPADGPTTGNPFVQGTGGSNSFRIPAMVTLNNGTLVAAADARWNTTYDGGGLDTIASYSTDNGANWNYTFANYLGDNGNTYNGSGSTAFIDPALATDGSTVYMLCDLYPYGVALNGSGNTAPSTAVGFNSDGKLLLSSDNHSSYGYYLDGGKIYSTGGAEVSGLTVDAYFNVSGTYNGITYNTNLFFSDSPFKVVRTGYLYLTSSTDGGKTWSAPTLIPNVKTSSEQVCLVGPGRGLVTYVNNTQTIIFPVYSYNGSSDSQRMGFIYSTDRGKTWTRVDSSVNWSSEAAVVELSDGTLRFFYRNGTSNLCYADYSWTTNSWGSAVNTGIATNSNTQISAISLQNTVDGKQVILVSCPTGSNNAGSADSSASARLNGRIQIGLVDSENYKMTWQTPIDVTTNNSQFMYSCLTALTDSEGNQTGKVAILYENQESAWGTGSNCYYTMDFQTYNLGLTFDEVVDDNIVSDNTGVEVNFGSNNVTSMDVEEAQVTALAGKTYVAYNITPADGYTGSAEVTIPLTDALKNAANLTGFVVENGSIKCIAGSRDGDNYTFTTPHFSVMGVADLKTENIKLTVGESKEVPDDTGNYESSYTGEGLDTSIATVTVKGTTTGGTPAVEEKTDKVTSLSAGTYIIGNGTQWLTLNGSTPGHITEASQATQWTIAKSGSSWTIKSGDYYLYHSTNDASLSVSKNSSTWSYDGNSGFYYTYNKYGQRTAYLNWNGSNWEAKRNPSNPSYGAAYTYMPAQAAVPGTASTEITFTGVSAGKTSVTVGDTLYNITVNRKTQAVNLSVDGTATFTDASTNVTVADSTVASATLSGDQLTIKGLKDGTTTVTTDTTTYTVNVSNATHLSIPQGSSETISVTLADGQYVKWTSANSSYVGVAGVYDATNLVYTNEATVFGQQMTNEVGPIEVTGTIYNSDGTVASASKWLVTVTEAAEGTTSVTRYYDVDQVENCVMYYSINGGELVQVNGTGVSIIPTAGVDNSYTVIDGTWYGDMSLMFFAAPNEGYALTHLFVEDSANQYYVLSDGENDDVTKSSAWPFNDGVDPEAVYTSNGHTYSIEEIASLYKLNNKTIYNTVHASNDIWKVNNGSRHGFRWALLEGYVTPARLQELYEAARALGCTGVTTVTKGSSNNTNTGTAADPISVCAVAQPLATLDKEVTKITDTNGADVTEAGIVKIGYTISYKVTVTVPATPAVVKYWNGSSIATGTDTSTISYTNMVVTDSLSDYATNFSWTQTTATSSTTTGNNQTNPVMYTITLTKDNFGSVVTGGTITNTATLDYNYTASYGTGSHKSSVEKVLDITVDIPNYVVDFGLPVEINLAGSTSGSGRITKVENGTYGTAAVNSAGTGFTYTPTTILQAVDYVQFTYQLDSDNTDYTYRVAIYPATTVYYEEGFADMTGFSGGSKGTGNQATQIAGESTDEYGYDAAYVTDVTVGASNGTQATSSAFKDKATFTFTGTGVDIYANTTPETGNLSIKVAKDGSTVKLIQVATAMVNGTTDATVDQNVTAYNVPVASITGLDHGTYDVTITHVKSSSAATDATKEVVNLDGFRVYGTLKDEPDFYKTDLEDKPTFIELRDQVLAGLSKTSDGSGQVNAALPSDTTVAVVASSDKYTQANVDDLLENGPKNEIYLQPGMALVLNIKTSREVQIGLKALNAATTYTINNVSKSISTSTDMFYTVLNKGTSGDQTITITNTGKGILSITKLKVCDDPAAALVPLTEDDLTDAYVALGIIEGEEPTDPETPTDPEEPTDPVEPETPETPVEPEPTPDPEPEQPAQPSWGGFLNALREFLRGFWRP